MGALNHPGCLQARQLQEQGKAVLVDVRVESNFNYEHAKDAVNVGLFRQVQGKSFLENVKRFAMGSLAMEATGEPRLLACPFSMRSQSDLEALFAACWSCTVPAG